MWIHFIKTVYGESSGGGLDEPFRYMGRIISDRFQVEQIGFPYGEIEINLVSLSPEEQNEKTIAFYSKLPYYYRGKTMVRVILPMLKEEENLTDVFQFIHKAFDVIIAKRKKTDGFDAEKLKSTLVQLEKELHTTDLWELSSKYKNIFRQETIEANLRDRALRAQSSAEKSKLIYDLRFMYDLPNTDSLYFDPYDYHLCGMILEKLREKKFRLPGYTHLYIEVADTYENALLHATRPVNWFVYGIAVLEDYADFATMNEGGKKRVVFDLIKQGLTDIANNDNLDTNILNEALDEVEQKYFR